MIKQMTKQELSNLMAAAVKTNAERDQMERGAGFAAVSDCDSQNQLRTAQLAIECGLLVGDVSAIAEGAAMIAKITNYYPWLEQK
jgi:hypothetical protein